MGKRKSYKMDIKRQKFQGVLNILSFNRHFYVYGISFLIVFIITSQIYGFNNTLFWLIILGSIYGLVIPLVVSAYVYDYSRYYEMNWLKQMKLDDNAQNVILNINAGFDETSYLLKQIFTKSRLQVFDFYNVTQHTEKAIVRARKASIGYPETAQISTDAIPLEDHSVDYIFLLSAAHEIRDNAEKIEFLKECRRVCKPSGRIIMVEHLRDCPNFWAFTIGFTHFFSTTTWKKVIKSAGFKSVKETKFTLFMSIFNFK